MQLWQKTADDIWQGRDDSSESPLAKRLFQTVTVAEQFNPQNFSNHVALLGFLCDEGVRLNKGRVGAKDAPNAIRRVLANMAEHSESASLVDFGDIAYSGDSLESVQAFFAEHITKCQKNGLPTIVLGGGHETAYAHGKGIFDAYPNKTIGIINFDAHLDVRNAASATSGTPFKQLYDDAMQQNKAFHYLCIGASLPGNTAALIETAKAINAEIIWDSECYQENSYDLKNRIAQFIAKVDLIYLTIDLDALPSSEMFAVSAPSAYGVPLRQYLQFADWILESNKLVAVDFVEYNPSLDRDQLSAKSAARMVWHFCYQRQKLILAVNRY